MKTDRRRFAGRLMDTLKQRLPRRPLQLCHEAACQQGLEIHTLKFWATIHHQFLGESSIVFHALSKRHRH